MSEWEKAMREDLVVPVCVVIGVVWACLLSMTWAIQRCAVALERIAKAMESEGET